MKEQGKISGSLPKLTCDLRAEVVVADLLERGFNANDIIIYPHGSFRRRYKKDVSHIEEISLSNGRTGIGVHINRDGIYDALPEALFHDVPTENVKGVNEMARNSKKQKLREKESRSFFLPFENELFYQRVLLELVERKVVQRLSENLLYDIFPGFWNIERDLPKEFVSRMMLFLQYSHKFVGNLELTAQILSLILNEKVTMQWQTGTPDQLPETHKQVKASGLGAGSLGVDFVCGSPQRDSFRHAEFIIGPLQNSSMADYLINGKADRFIEMFFGYFIPLEIIATKRVMANPQKNKFVLGGDTPSFLGFDTTLQPQESLT